jgi:hypothetical protein
MNARIAWIAIMLAPAPALAQPRASLAYQVAPELAASCWDGDRFQDEVASLAAEQIFAEGAARQIRIEVQAFAGGVLAQAREGEEAVALARASDCEAALAELARDLLMHLSPTSVPPPREQPAQPPQITPVSPSAIPAGFAPIHVRASEPLTLHLQIGASNVMQTRLTDRGRSRATSRRMLADYTMLCVAPCDVYVPTGTQRLAISRGAGKPVASAHPIEIVPDLALDLSYESGEAWQIAGWIGAIAGFTTIAGGLIAGAYLDDGWLMLGFGIGGGVLAALGTVAVTVGGDRAHIEVAGTF